MVSNVRKTSNFERRKLVEIMLVIDALSIHSGHCLSLIIHGAYDWFTFETNGLNADSQPLLFDCEDPSYKPSVHNRTDF